MVLWKKPEDKFRSLNHRPNSGESNKTRGVIGETKFAEPKVLSNISENGSPYVAFNINQIKSKLKIFYQPFRICND